MLHKGVVMKFYKVILFMLLMTSLISCNDENERVLFDENNNYIGFEDVVYEMNYEDAINHKYVIIEDIWIKENYNQIELFMKEANNGNKMFLRFRNSFENGMILFYTDLFHDNDGYYFYYQDELDLKKDSYQYLVEVEGLWMPGDYRRILVVTDDPNITMEQIHDARISATFDMETNILKHRVVLVNYHELD